MKGGFTQDNLAEMAQWITESLKKQERLIDQYLQLHQEVAGIINLDADPAHFFKLVKEGNAGEPIVEAVVFPYDTKEGVLMNWHTHPLSLEMYAHDHLPKNAIRNVPSWLDVNTLTRASILQKQSAVDIVISKQGYFFIRLSDEFLAFLLQPEIMPDHELIIEDVLKDGVTYIAHKYFHENLSIQNFCEEMATVFKNNSKKNGFRTFGQDCVYIPRH